jgi:hypothetical protein
MAALSVEAIAALTPAQLAKLTNEQVRLSPHLRSLSFLGRPDRRADVLLGRAGWVGLGSHQAHRCDVLLGYTAD